MITHSPFHVSAEKKPVRFPRTPSFHDILKMLEEKNREKRMEKLQQKIQERKDDFGLPEIELDQFFKK